MISIDDVLKSRDAENFRAHIKEIAEADYLLHPRDNKPDTCLLLQAEIQARPLFIIDYLILENISTELSSKGKFWFLALIWNAGKTECVPFSIDKKDLEQALYYYFRMLKRDPRQREEPFISEGLDAGRCLHDMFLTPLLPYLDTQMNPHLVVKMNPPSEGNHFVLHEKLPLLDFQFLFALRWWLADEDEQVLVTTVHPGFTIEEMIRRMSGFHKVLPKDIILLFSGVEEWRKRDPKAMKKCHQALSAAKEKGAKVDEQATKQSLINALQEPGKVIQIVAHYDSWKDSVQMYDEDLSVKALRCELTRLKEQGKLATNLNIDAFLCGTFASEFDKTLYGHAALVFSSPEQIKLEVAAELLLELYTGNYLDGKTYIHEAWQKVSRNRFQRVKKMKAWPLSLKNRLKKLINL